MRRSFLGALVPTALWFAACGADAETSSTVPARPTASAPVGASGAGSSGAPSSGALSTGSGVMPRDAANPGENAAPSVQLLGRFDTRDPAGPKASWPGARIVARFHGRSVSVKMNEIDDAWEVGAPSAWDVTIDGQPQPRLLMQAGTHDYALASGMPDGDHTVELFKRTEAQDGITQFLGFDFAGGTLLAPPGRKERKLEVIGDSHFAGYGVDGVMGRGDDCEGPAWSSRWENFHESAGADLASTLDAEVHGTVFSGKGIYKNLWRPNLETMPQIFLRANPLEKDSLWDFAQYTPAAVLVMIGGIDFAIGQPTDDGPSTLAEFSDAYEAFAKTIRSKYADAHIFLIVSPSVSDQIPAGRNARTNVLAGVHTTVERRRAAGDARVYEVIPPVATPDELVACDAHGTPAFHQHLAEQLAPLVRAATGWQ